MKRIYLFCCIIQSMLLINCSNKSSDLQDTSLPYLIDFEQCISNARNIKISDIADTIELIELKSPEEIPISMIWQFIPVGDYWYIHASEGVYKFTDKGEFVTTIGKKGQGPGEYLYLFNIAINQVKDEIAINDSRKMHFYNLEGEYLRSENKTNTNAARIDFSDSILWCTSLGRNDVPFLLFGINEQRDTIHSISNPFWGIKSQDAGTGGSYMALSKYFYSFQNTLYFNGPACNDTVYQLKGSECTPHVVFNMGKYKLPLEYEAWYNFEANWKNGYHFWNIPAIAEDDRYLFILAQRYAPLNGDRANREDIYRYLMYDKKERIGFRMNENKDEKIIDDILVGPSIWPYWVTNDYYVGLIDPYSYKKKIKEGNYKLSPAMQKTVDSWDHDTNIILMLCRKKKIN